MIKIEIPNQIRIAGFEYTILINPENDKELDAENIYGKVSSELGNIALLSRCDASQMSYNFTHEILHAISHHFIAELTENQVKALASGLHQVLEQLGLRFRK